MDDLPETPAQTAQLEAEAKKLLAEAKKMDAEADAAIAAEARAVSLDRYEQSKAEYEAEVSRYAARKAQLELNKAERDERLILSQFQYQHTFNFFGGVDMTTAGACIERLNQWHQIDPGCDITIVFTSPGGGVIAGMALYDYIRWMSANGHHVTSIALGEAASMAGILLQSGDRRVMARGAWLLIHEVSFVAMGKIGEVEDEFHFGQRLKEQAAAIFVERSGGKLTREFLEDNWKRKDWYLSSEESLALGLCDEIR